ncbi:16S rRNA (uracil(1498)-N(3))-methyltransferase [Campylobacter geochelonis]|uniref:Ribosomal RNA small subunit methyltransferase E n=1 Tax=Campylobacter geochelonis TaxID=1780362 RepID=A0A128EAP9_9BACT|nr:16S rRNA (uracil(1498)-N(3))-methyltransferase [Campylobacter geochelonis]QKF70560.1 16S rRNA m3U1498 methyltransferase [Campylobacter geochelonis]CZE46035.1 16S ribosomal RNA methyltransferase RsmE [Campylobacter geochelonis]CZE46599.1 16S ribosomal RNA methyltransferase RsmE [Campylobacter geochelonis]
MTFLYSKMAGDEQIVVENEQFNHLKARRAKLSERIDVRNLKDGFNYIYEIREIGRKSANLELIFKNSVAEIEHKLSLAWAVVESSVIEKTLPMLNEMGVFKLIFVYCDFSQKNIKLDLDRFERILIASSQQCGRNSLLQIEVLKDSKEFFDKFSQISLIDFGGKNLANATLDEIFFIGPEGGFSQEERELFNKSYGLNSPYILRSNSAIVAIASKMLL